MRLLLPGLLVGILVAWAPAQATDPTWRKDGLWEVTLRQEGHSIMRAIRVQQCSTADHEPAILLSIMPGQENCMPAQISRNGDSVEIWTNCRVHENSMTAYMSLKGDFSAHYEGRFSVLQGESPEARSSATILVARWLGACRAEMKPGDMVLSNGITVNVLKDREHRSNHGHQH